MVTLSLGVALITLIAVTISLALIRPVLASRQLIDMPNHRSSHSQPTLRGGGVGIVAGLLVGLGLSAWLLSGTPDELIGAVTVGVTAGALAVLGFIEDSRGLPVGVRLVVQATICGITAAGLILIAGASVGLGIVAWVAGVFYVNAANFMDGVNGISGMHGVVVGSYFTILGLVSNEPGLMLSAIAIGAAFLGFLPWNARRARMFMGDVGSYALGGAVWAVAASAIVIGVPWLTAAAPLLVYSADVTITLIRRALRGAPLTEAHHDHGYQRVFEITHSHGTAAAAATAGTIACAVIGIWSWFAPDMLVWALASITAILALYVATPWILARRATATAWSDGAVR